MQRAPLTTRKGDQIQDDNGNNLWVFDAKNANRALELLGKHLGIFRDKIDVSNSDGSLAPRQAINIDFSQYTPEQLAELARAAFRGE